MRAYPASADTTRFLCVQEGAVRVAGRMSGYLCPPECPRSDDKSVQEGAVSGSFGRAPLTCPAKRPRTCFLLLPTCEALACVPTTKVLVFVRKKMPPIGGLPTLAAKARGGTKGWLLSAMSASRAPITR